MRRPLNLWLFVVVAICVASIWFGKGITLPAIKHVSPVGIKPQVEDFSQPDILPNIHLLILNGTEEKGLARDFSLMVGRIGCVAQSTGNAPSKPWARSILVNRRLSNERARHLAAQLGGLEVIREFDGRATEDAVLVLGQDHSELKKKLDPRSLLEEQNR